MPTGRKRPAKIAFRGAGGCPLRPQASTFTSTHVWQHSASARSPYGLSLLRCSSLSLFHAFFLPCQEKQQVCRLRGFRPRRLAVACRRPSPDVSPSQFQRHRCCAQLPPAFVSHVSAGRLTPERATSFAHPKPQTPSREA